MHGSRTCSIAHIHEQIDIEYLVSGNCLIWLKNKKIVGGLGDFVPQKLKPFS